MSDTARAFDLCWTAFRAACEAFKAGDRERHAIAIKEWQACKDLYEQSVRDRADWSSRMAAVMEFDRASFH
jgi:hypothetical protein